MTAVSHLHWSTRHQSGRLLTVLMAPALRGLQGLVQDLCVQAAQAGLLLQSPPTDLGSDPFIRLQSLGNSLPSTSTLGQHYCVKQEGVLFSQSAAGALFSCWAVFLFCFAAASFLKAKAVRSQLSKLCQSLTITESFFMLSTCARVLEAFYNPHLSYTSSQEVSSSRSHSLITSPTSLTQLAKGQGPFAGTSAFTGLPGM